MECLVGTWISSGNKSCKKIKQKRLVLRLPPLNCFGRTVIIVDDGIVTGSTMIAAIHSIRKEKPSKIIVAAPICFGEALSKIEKKADMVHVLHVPPQKNGSSLAQFYIDYTPVSDVQVMQWLDLADNKIQKSGSMVYSSSSDDNESQSDASSSLPLRNKKKKKAWEIPSADEDTTGSVA